MHEDIFIGMSAVHPRKHGRKQENNVPRSTPKLLNSVYPSLNAMFTVHKGLVILSILLLVSSISFLLVSPVNGQVARLPHFEKLKIQDPNGIDWTDKAIVAGGIYYTDFDLVVEESLPGTKLVLATNLEKTTDTYWKLKNPYPGINTTTWQPGLREIRFDASKGTASFTLVGKVPESYTLTTPPDNYTLHKETSLTLLQLSLATGQITDKRVVLITDKEILKFDSAFQEKSNLINNTSTDSRFEAFYIAMLNVTKSLKAKGDVETGLQLLNSLPDAANIIPPPPKGVSGAVYDAVSGSPLAEVTITVGSITTKSMSDGSFNVAAVSAPTTLKASLEGYDPLTIEIPALNPYTFYTLYMQETIPPAVSPLYLYATVGLACVAGILGILWAMSSSRAEYLHRRVGEQVRRLDLALIKLHRIDKELASEVSQVKEDLEKLSGKR